MDSLNVLPCKNGIKFQDNYVTDSALEAAIKKGNTDPYVLFVKGYTDEYDLSPTFFQAYTLTECKKLVEYLNGLIARAEKFL